MPGSVLTSLKAVPSPPPPPPAILILTLSPSTAKVLPNPMKLSVFALPILVPAELTPTVAPVTVPLNVVLPVIVALPATVKLAPTLKSASDELTNPKLNALYATNSSVSNEIAAVVSPTVEPSEAV